MWDFQLKHSMRLVDRRMYENGNYRYKYLRSKRTYEVVYKGTKERVVELRKSRYNVSL